MTGTSAPQCGKAAPFLLRVPTLSLAPVCQTRSFLVYLWPFRCRRKSMHFQITEFDHTFLQKKTQVQIRILFLPGVGSFADAGSLCALHHLLMFSGVKYSVF